MINNKNKLNTLTARMLDKNVPNVGVMSLAVCLSVCLSVSLYHCETVCETVPGYHCQHTATSEPDLAAGTCTCSRQSAAVSVSGALRCAVYTRLYTTQQGRPLRHAALKGLVDWAAYSADIAA